MASTPRRRRFWWLLGGALWAIPVLAQQGTNPPDPDQAVSKEEGESEAIEKREEWFYEARKAGTKGDMAQLRLQAVQFTQSREALLGASPEAMGMWTSRGPSSSRFGSWQFGRVSGRITSLAKDWANNILYAGSASGGVWKTTNDGASWAPIFESAGTMTVGAVAVDPNTPTTLWVGTGENTKYWCEDYFGIGILRSTNGGNTWEIRNGSGANTLENLTVFAGVLIDPRNSDRLVVGGRSRDCQTGTYGLGGIYSTTDAGATWTRRLQGYVTSLTRSPDPDVLWAGVYGGGVYKSTDNGVTWLQQTASGLPTGSDAQRVEVTVAPSDGKIIYALYASVVSNAQAELWRSTDGGGSWTRMATGTTACDGQCHYNLTLRVHPTTTSTLYRGTIQVFRSTNGGTSWSNLTGSWGSSQKVHQDTHVVLINPANGNEIYVGSDGGVWKTTNGGSSFSNLNSNLNLTQFYDIGIKASSDDVICGGAQDNSSLARTTENVWDVQTVTGDGMVCAIHPTNAQINYITSYPTSSLPSVYRSTNGILGSYSKITGSSSGIAATSRIDWVTPYTLSPSNPSTLFLGTYQMYRSTNGGTAWSPVGPADMTGGGNAIISTVTVGRGNGNHVYAGTSDGRVWRSNDGGTSWLQLAGGLPTRRINDVDGDPTDPERVFCVVSGFNTAHLFEYKDGWIARGNGLPNVPANSVFVLSATEIYVGTDVGVFVSYDGGINFVPFNLGLPAGLVVTDLEYNATTGTLTAGTYGRGAWQQTLCRALDQCHDVGTHDPGTGLCTNPAKPDGAACTDGIPCTAGDSCQAGACTSGAPVICAPVDSCHNAGTCDAGTGICSNPVKPDGASCDDGDACTRVDACQTGACLGSDPVTCTAIDACHLAGTCDAESGICSTPARADGTPCSDDDACTQGDSCQMGVCTSGNPVDCSATGPCQLDGTCDAQTGTCSQPVLPDDTPCSDGNACTQSDSCQSGACVGTDPVICSAPGPCLGPGTCNTQSGVCSDPIPLDGAACDDGDPCTSDDVCSAGQCSGDPATPAEITNVEIGEDKATMIWAANAEATRYDVVRGSIFALPVGSDGASEACFADLLEPMLVDPTEPPPDGGFWYLSRGENACGNGSFGSHSDGSPRATTACP